MAKTPKAPPKGMPGKGGVLLVIPMGKPPGKPPKAPKGQ